MTALCLTLLAVGCLGCVPMGFEADKGDGGVDYPPVIVDSVPPMPGPHTIDSTNPSRYTVDVKDHDLGDHLFLRVFRSDLTNPLTIVDAIPPDTGNPPNPVRKVEFFTNAGWCDQVNEGETRIYDVIVADQPFESPTEPGARDLPAGAESSRMTWILKCSAM